MALHDPIQPGEIAELNNSDRFDQRVLNAMWIGIALCAVMIFGHVIANGDLSTFMPHIATLILAAAVVATSRDAVSGFLFTNVFWMFLFTIYLYQTLSLVTVNTGFYDAVRVANIVLVSQAGLTLAHFLSPKDQIFTQDFIARHGDVRALSHAIEPVFFVLGVAGIIGSAQSLLPPALGALLISMFYVGVAIRASRLGASIGKDVLFWMAFVVMAWISVSNNSRTTLFAFLLVSLTLLVIFRDKLFSPWIILAIILGFPLLNVFSEVSLSIRYARSSGAPIQGLFAQQFLTPQTWIEAINPFDRAATKPTLEQINQRSGFTSNVFGPQGGGVPGRLTLMPHMDIVTARLPNNPPIDWTTFRGIAGTSFPSIGQPKELIYSDEIVWDLGLRSRSSLGRPMITAQGELFALGGYTLVFFVPAVAIMLLNGFYRLVIRVTVSRVTAIVVTSTLLVNAVLSTTLLSLLSNAFSAPLMILAAIILVMTLARGFTKGQAPTDA